VFLYSSFGAENPWLTRSAGLGTATNKLIPYALEPVTAGFRSQEFTVRVRKIDGHNAPPTLAVSAAEATLPGEALREERT